MHSRSKFKKWLISVLVLVALALVLLVGAFFTIQSTGFKTFLRNKLVSAINNSLQAKLHIGSIKGDLYSHIIVNDIILQADSDTLAAIAALDIKYNAWALLSSRLIIKQAVIKAPNVNLATLNSGGTNWQNLTKPSQTQDKNDKPSKWQFQIDDLRLHNGSFVLNYTADSSQQELTATRIELAAMLSKNKDLQGAVTQLGFVLPDKETRIDRLSCNFFVTNDSVRVDNIQLLSEQSSLTGNLTYDLLHKMIRGTKLNASPLSLNELKQWVPIPVLPESVDLDAEYQHNGQQHRARLSIDYKDQSLKMNAVYANPQSYTLTAQTFNTFLQDWIDLPQQIQDTRFTGNVNITGTGNSWNTSIFDFTLDLTDALIYDQSIEKLVLNGHKKGKNILAEITDFEGPADLNFNGQLYLSDTLYYDFELALGKFNIPLLHANDMINVHLRNRGEWNGSSLTNRFSLRSDSLQIKNVSVSGLTASGIQSDRSLRLNAMTVKGQFGQFDIKGNANLDRFLDITYLYQGGDWSAIYPAIPIRFEGTAAGNFKGRTDSLKLTTRLNLTNVRLDSNRIGHLSGDVRAGMIGPEFIVDSEISANSIQYGTHTADSLHILGGYQDSLLTSNIMLAFNDSMSVNANGSLDLSDTLSIVLGSLQLQLPKQKWSGNGAPVVVQKFNDTWQIKQAQLWSGKQQIQLTGELSPHDRLNMELQIDSLDIHPITRLLVPEHILNGTLNGEIEFTGPLSDPSGKSRLYLTEASIDQWQPGDLHTEITLKDRQCIFLIDIYKDTIKLLQFNGDLGLDLEKKEGPSLVPRYKIRALSKGMGLDFVNLFLPKPYSITGNMEMDLTYEKDQKARLNGELYFKNTKISNLEYNSNIDNLDLKLTIANSHAALAFLSQKKSGSFTGKGTFDINPDSGPENMNIDLDIQNYRLAGSRKLDLITNGSLNIAGSFNKPVITGQANLEEAKVYLPDFQSGNHKKIQGPILATEFLPESSNGRENKDEKQQSLSSLETRIKLVFNRNIWIKNEDMNVELGGNLDIIKLGPDFQYFGQINIRRGMLNLYGKRFEITSGEVTLQGTKEINPVLDIEAAHSFRDIYSNKHRLVVLITGNANTPQITFSMDDETIDQTNAVSFLLFGRRVNELSYGEKKQMYEYSGFLSSATIENWVTMRLTSPITRSIQNRLDLDVIEFKGGSDWKQASIVLGKYITTDLYLSYLQEFNLGRSHELVSEQISLEYEINRRLFLQATKGDDKTTGVDIVVKYEK